MKEYDIKKVLYRDLVAIAINQNGSSIIKFFCRADATDTYFIELSTGKKFVRNNDSMERTEEKIHFDKLYKNIELAVNDNRLFFRGLPDKESFKNIKPNLMTEKFHKRMEEWRKNSSIIDVKQLLEFERYFYKTYKREVKAKRKENVRETTEQIRMQYFDLSSISQKQNIPEVKEERKPTPEEIEAENQKQKIIIANGQVEDIFNKARALSQCDSGEEITQ